MTFFVRLLDSTDKNSALINASTSIRSGVVCAQVFQPKPDTFFEIPGTPFAYRASHEIRSIFKKMPSFEANGRAVKQGLATADDFRFVRVWWEALPTSPLWFSYAKGSVFSPFYCDIRTVVNWGGDGAEIKNNLNKSGGIRSNIWMLQETAKKFFLKPGLTWPLRGSRISVQAVPKGCIFSVAGKMAFAEADELSAIYGVMNSKAYLHFLRTLSDAVRIQFEVGLIQRTPIPEFSAEQREQLRRLAFKGWSLKRKMDGPVETSHAFLLPSSLCHRLGEYNPTVIEAELEKIQAEIDAISFELYGFSEADRHAALGESDAEPADENEVVDDDAEESEPEAPPVHALLSWGVGVAFGRFDWRLATGERQTPPEPDPFAPLPAKSPGMLPDGAEPFHAHCCMLVDDQSHPHDLARLVEEVLARVNVTVPDDVRRWLQKDFFAFHLQRYSKSRRKAPIYWPLATISGSYTLWVYYPSLNNQTLFTAVNDFLDGPNGKLTQVSRECAELRIKGSGRSRDEEKQYETLQTFEQELTDLRDTLLKIAPTYQPNHDDGVQITAAPLWPLFRHKPWQKVLKDAWTKLEKGDYDWAHLAMAYWPERVREKCKTDKSVAIAHGREDLYVEAEVAPKKTRGKKMAGGEE